MLSAYNIVKSPQKMTYILINLNAQIKTRMKLFQSYDDFGEVSICSGRLRVRWVISNCLYYK